MDERKPVFSVVRGNPSAEELAVVIALFAARGSAAAMLEVPTVGGWAERSSQLRAPISHGHGAWAASARQR